MTFRVVADGHAAHHLRRHILGVAAEMVTHDDRTGPHGSLVADVVGQAIAAAGQNHRAEKGTATREPYQRLNTCGPCTYLRWLQCDNAYDGRVVPGRIRLLADRRPETHIC